MKTDLSNRVKELRKNVYTLKTAQMSQNDSYGYYAYQSENLWGQYWNTISVEFIPYSRKAEDVVVTFDCAGGNIVQFGETIDQTTTNPLKGVLNVMAYQAQGGQGDFWHSVQGQDFPEWARYFYISCYSNCAGELKLTLNGNGVY